MINRIFDLTVAILDSTAKRLDPYIPGGMDYTKINVLLMFAAFASAGLNVVLLLLLLL